MSLSSSLDELRNSSAKVSRLHNLDILKDDEGKEIAFCHLLGFMPLTQKSETSFRAPFNTGLNGVLSVLLAIEHLNTGNGTIVKEVEGLDKKCNVRFTGEFFDTEYKESKAVNDLLGLFQRKPAMDQLPCAFIGAVRTAVSMPMSMLTGIEGYPQISHFSTGSQLDDKSQYRMFGRVIPSDDGTALPVISYLKDILDSDFLGVIHVDDAYGYGYSASLLKIANIYAPSLQIQSIDIPYHNPTPEQIQVAVEFLKSTQYRVFFGIITKRIYNDLMTEAYNKGIAGPKFTWIFADSLSLNSIAGAPFPKDSPLAIASSGTLRLAATSTASTATFDSFEKSWLSLNNPADINYIESKIPKLSIADNDTIHIEELFDSPSLTGSSFLYDATIALGLGACQLNQNNQYFEGWKHFQSILNTSFMGSSGNITFDSNTGTRVPSSATFQLVNFQALETSGEELQLQPITVKLFQNGQWVDKAPTIFCDGTSKIPLPIPALEENYNYIGTASRTIGLFICVCILLSSFLFASWTQRNKDSKIVGESQIYFMYFICSGIFIMGSTIIPLSIDDEKSSLHVCNGACIVSPWLFAIGFGVAFSALLSKTWRLNDIVRHSTLGRIQATAKDLVKPMYFIMFSNILILTIWTSASPRQWERVVTEEDIFGRSISSFGHCNSKKEILFTTLLILLNIGAMFIALYQAYIGRHIQTPLKDIKYIVLTICTFLLVLSMGIPIIILVYEEPRAIFFVEILLISVACSSLIIFILWPKIKLHKRLKDGSLELNTFEDEANFKEKNISLRSITEYTSSAKSLLRSVSLRLGRVSFSSSVSSIRKSTS